MKLDVSKVEFSNYDLIHGVKLPKILTRKLAYFSGIHFGDGNLGNYKKYYYSLEYSGHLVDEYEFYTVYFQSLFKNLFNKELRVYEKLRPTGNYLSLCTQSKALFTFLKNSIGLPVGKKSGSSLPSVILDSAAFKDFIRGFADSDFCLSFKVGSKKLNNYPVISVNSNNKLAIKQTEDILIKLNFDVSSMYEFPKKRYDKYYTSSQIEICGEEQLELWMKKIGFNSRKHITKYLVWKKFGFCPPHTILPQRETILKGELDPYSFYRS